jgi:hypothetical protein
VHEIKVKTAAMTRIGRHDSEFRDIFNGAAKAVLAGIEPRSIAATFFASFAPTELCQIADPAALAADTLAAAAPGYAAPVHGPFLTGGEALFRALEHGVERGDVLVIGCEKMTHVEAARAAGLLAPRARAVRRQDLASNTCSSGRLFSPRHRFMRKAVVRLATADCWPGQVCCFVSTTRGKAAKPTYTTEPSNKASFVSATRSKPLWMGSADRRSGSIIRPHT